MTEIKFRGKRADNGDYKMNNQNQMELWEGMPEYENIKQPEPLITATFKFLNEEDYFKFKELVCKYIYNGEKVFDGMQKKEAKQAWYPHKPKSSAFEYIDEEK